MTPEIDGAGSRRAGRLRILFLTHRLPYAPNRGDRIRSYNILRFLAERADVIVGSLVHDREEASHAADVRAVAADVVVGAVPWLKNRARALGTLLTSRPLTMTLLHSPALRPELERIVSNQRPDVVLAFCSSMARFALEPPLDRIPLVIDMVDCDSAKWQSLAGESSWPKSSIYRREARTLSRFEAQAMARARVTFAVNAREVTILRALAPDQQVEVLEGGVDAAALAPSGPPTAAPRVVFCGVMNYPPNEAGAEWLVRSIWPLVRRLIPAAELRIVGASPTARVRALQSPADRVVVTGFVPDIRPELWSAAVSVAPLQIARGVQSKVLESVAARLPCVVTPVVGEGLPREVLPACLVADSAEEFASAVAGLLARPPAERRQIASVDLNPLSWNGRLMLLWDRLREAALGHAGKARRLTH